MYFVTWHVRSSMLHALFVYKYNAVLVNNCPNRCDPVTVYGDPMCPVPGDKTGHQWFRAA